MVERRPHVLGIDDGPFVKFRDRTVPVIGVVMSGRDLVEGIISTRVAVDGEGITEHLVEWINGSRFHPVLRGIVLDGITIAGLSVIDLAGMHEGTGIPVIAVSRRPPHGSRIADALRAAKLEERIPTVERAGPAWRFRSMYFECAGVPAEGARVLLEGVVGKSEVPEPIRIAHMIGQAIVLGSSRGRV